MRCLAVTIAVAALAVLTSCTIPTYNLDAIVIHGQPEVVDILSTAVTSRCASIRCRNEYA